MNTRSNVNSSGNKTKCSPKCVASRDNEYFGGTMSPQSTFVDTCDQSHPRVEISEMVNTIFYKPKNYNKRGYKVSLNPCIRQT